MEIVAAMETPLKQWRGDQKTEDVASKLGVTPAMWSRWENQKRAIPAHRVIDIEALTGISRHELRPDVFGPAVAPAEGQAA